ncbi:TetR/AcrR family transcriptional regulator [Curtobacterium sp. MCBA15_001]|uniref:TetR/AcrR family transcriptional regulator n=1 Tax=Curtobacterium sp. MCBA15_001 TaxID=1898731 RepID=UPI0008DDBC7D|nr:TetR family transcriptional regulator C-terminal domain-containing protein [Curtobacterium sp. MCBA15_001]OIH95536.1 hypothetical protein BIU90_02235 [Curtobacterium sp. MCBA15_001]
MREALPQPTPISGTQQRVRVIETAIATYRELAFHQVGYEQLAERSTLSTEEIRAHFPNWDGIVVATLDRWNTQRTQPLLPIAATHGTVRLLRAIVQANIEDPALMRFLTAMLNISATPGHPMAEQLQARWHGFHSMVQQSLARDVAVGREPATMDPARGAEQLIALYEGLQLQSMVRPRMDLLEAYDRAITRLRDGWTRVYVRPVWDLDDSIA